jgi:peptidoglycan hydrolase CwlO-like protein
VRTVTIEQNQHRLQEAIESNNQATAEKVAVLEEYLLRLQELLAKMESNTRSATDRMAAVEQNQHKLQERIEANIRQTAENKKSLEELGTAAVPPSPSEKLSAKAPAPVPAPVVLADSEQ